MKAHFMVFVAVLVLGSVMGAQAIAAAGLKAFSFAQQDLHPWAQLDSLKLLQEAQSLGVGQVVAEVQGMVKDDGDVTTIPVDGTIEDINDLQVWIMMARNLDRYVVVKLATPTTLPVTSFDRSWASYERFAIFHAKLAERTGAQEIAIPGGIASAACQKPEAVTRLINQMRFYFKGKLRIDYDSVPQYRRVSPCVSDLNRAPEEAGIDLPANPSRAILAEAVRTGLPITRITLDGDDAAERAERLLRGPEARLAAGMTFGPFTADLENRDEDRHLREVIAKWLD